MILGIDVGKKQGALVLEDGPEYKKIISTPFQSYIAIYKILEDIYTEFGPYTIIIGEAFGHREVVKQHSKWYGLIEYFAELHGLYVIYVSDRTARCRVLGKGNGNRKDLVHEHFKGDTPDISDAMLFCTYFRLTQ
jgi:hypothetical protein